MPPGSISIIRGHGQVSKTTGLKLLVADLISQDLLPRGIAYYPCDDIVHFRELISLIEARVDFVFYSARGRERTLRGGSQIPGTLIK